MVSGWFVFPWFDSTMEQALLWLAQTVITPENWPEQAGRDVEHRHLHNDCPASSV